MAVYSNVGAMIGVTQKRGSKLIYYFETADDRWKFSIRLICPTMQPNRISLKCLGKVKMYFITCILKILANNQFKTISLRDVWPVFGRIWLNSFKISEV